jgi:isoleucyl-tRNA synthetase
MEVIEGGTIQLQKKDKKEKVTLPPYGADVLRLWVSSVDYSADIPLSTNILKQLGDVRGKIRNTARFLLGNLHDFDPEKHTVPYEELPELDRYMLYRMTEVFEEVTEAFDTYQFFRFFQTIQNFCVVDLSNFYLDIAKDRLYISALDSPRRRSCQTVMAVALENLARVIAPVLCHMAEDIWQYLPYETPYKSVFESGWVKIEEKWKKPDISPIWTTWAQLEDDLKKPEIDPIWGTLLQEGRSESNTVLRVVRSEVNKVLEKARAEKFIGASLEAKVLLYLYPHPVETETIKPNILKEQLIKLNPQDSLSGNQVDELRYLFLASRVKIVDSLEEIEQANYRNDDSNIYHQLAVGVVKADGKKCDRCWNYSTRVGTISEHPLLCDRCVPALNGQF